MEMFFYLTDDYKVQVADEELDNRFLLATMFVGDPPSKEDTEDLDDLEEMLTNCITFVLVQLNIHDTQNKFSSEMNGITAKINSKYNKDIN